MSQGIARVFLAMLVGANRTRTEGGLFEAI